MMDISTVDGADPLAQAIATSASGMRAQATRLRIVAENLANANATASTPGGDPYRRKVVTFEQVLDRSSGAGLVRPARITRDSSPFRIEYDPSHPAANAQGYYKLPNVSEVIETADAREAQRSYEANLSALSEARTMITKTLDILKA
ncbi:MAG TPA: flagellar basal body rod protein FlgC [Acetobacteraceae bacterium]|nr:flagellar basal body rod protein FlgC [Acetobacteraceae bacterium]